MESSAATLALNLHALVRTSPAAVKLIGTTQARQDVTWTQTSEGLAASISEWGELGPGFGDPVQRPLCSRRRPISEAEAMAAGVDVSSVAAVVVLGFGCGHHVAAIGRKLKKTGVLIVFEPDVELLRAVFEMVDCTEWISAANIILMTSATDDAQIVQALAGAEAFLAMGTSTLEHAPSRSRLAGQGAEFLTRFTGAMKAIRTTMITTMAQSRATVRNLTQNIDHYVLGPGIAPLRNVLAGRTAIVVSAGPSLARNVALLENPIARDRFCIIAAQTVLRPLIARGIKPHIVAALDYHELSGRFYEGLTAEQLQGVTLIVEPKVNPAVPSAFAAAAGLAPGSGRIRCVGDGALDEIIGPALAKSMGSIESGATVAHLAYYLARYFGCDPVVMIGQDLGFTGGRYYSSGAAIHDIWAPELNAFNTLEMHEWQRIVRMRSLLRPMPDHDGRMIYSDEQMATYLSQFQRDFARDAQAGLVTVDATEGGVRKQHTTVMTLAAAMERYQPATDAVSISQLLTTPDSGAAAGGRPAVRAMVSGTKAKLRQRLEAVAEDSRRIAAGSDEAAALLHRMIELHDDQQAVNGLIQDVYRVRDRVTKLQPAYKTVERMNQTGAFNRYRADRRLHTDSQTDEMKQQAAQIGRDIANVRSIADCADHLSGLLKDAIAILDGRPRVVRESLAELARAEKVRQPLVVNGLASLGGKSDTDGVPDVDAANANQPVVGLVVARRGGSPLGTAQALAAPFGPGSTLLAVTVSRVLRTAGIERVVVATDDASWATNLLGALAADPAVSVLACDATAGLPLSQFAAPVVRAARGFAAECWRSGISGLTVYDECFAPAVVAHVCGLHTAGGALIVDGSWGLVDPVLCAKVVERYKEDRSSHRVTFTLAAPGLCGFVADAILCEQLKDAARIAGMHSSVGGLLSYVPVAPMNDPISRSMCVPVEPALRDVPVRLCIDTVQQAGIVRRLLERQRLSTASASAAEVANAVQSAMGHGALDPFVPAELELDVSGEPWHAAGGSTARDVQGWLLRFEALGADAGQPGEQMAGPWRVHIRCDETTDMQLLARLVDAVKLAGGLVHLRSSLFGGVDEAARLLAIRPDVVSVDVHATDPVVFATVLTQLGRVGGSEEAATRAAVLWQRRCEGMDHLSALISARGTSFDLPLIVPRLAKCDATLGAVEDFYDNAIMRYGWAVIDGPSGPLVFPGGALQPLGEPAQCAARAALSRGVVERSARVVLRVASGIALEAGLEAEREAKPVSIGAAL